MAITLTCECGKALQVPDTSAGKKGKCPKCGSIFKIPAREDGVVAAAEVLPVVMPAKTPPPLPPEYDLPPPPAKPARSADEDDELEPLRTHAGTEVAEDDDFFAEAPPEIGRVLSAYTGLKAGKQPMPLALRIVVLGLATVLTLLVGGVLLVIFGAHVALLIGIPVVVLVVFCVAFYFTQFMYTCSYVGRKGVAEYQCMGNRDNINKKAVFLFEDAAELRTAQTRHYYNGVYTGTDYNFTWSDEDGKKVFALSGNYKSQEGNPKPSSPFHFAVAAEIAWTEYLSRNVDVLTAGDKMLHFGLKGKDYVRMDDGLLLLKLGGKKIELEADQIEAVQIDQGVVAVREVGAKDGWFSSTGVHRFQYADLGNARFFLFAMEKVVGVRFVG